MKTWNQRQLPRYGQSFTIEDVPKVGDRVIGPEGASYCVQGVKFWSDWNFQGRPNYECEYVRLPEVPIMLDF